MSLAYHARKTPKKAAVISPETGEQLTFGDLNTRSIQLSRLLHRHLEIGERFSLLLENGATYFAAAWAGRRAGLRFVPVNWHLGIDEAVYIIQNSDSRVLIASPRLADVAQAVADCTPELRLLLSEGEAFASFTALDDDLSAEPVEALDPEVEGVVMFYSSGTTGQPKGVLKPLSGMPFGTNLPIENNMARHFECDDTARFYTPAPLYHGAPTGWSMGAQQLGGTVVVPKRFDAEAALRHIQDYKITHAQFVPTHFIRILQLPEGVRSKYDMSSLRMVVHSAAPCPAEVKEMMMAWWGPIIHEYYGQSEGGSMTAIGPRDWLDHKGSVGRCVKGAIHIVDEEGQKLPPGETGHLMFETEEQFEYHKEPEKTAETFDEKGWIRTGDMGWINPEGYLYLTDRASHMIISGGVNIYPQEIEIVLLGHAGVRDVAVIGVPDPEFGEQVKAVVERVDDIVPDADLADELLALCRGHLAGYKCPKSIDFVSELPRLPTGKLLKRELRKRYWPEGRTL